MAGMTPELLARLKAVATSVRADFIDRIKSDEDYDPNEDGEFDEAGEVKGLCLSLSRKLRDAFNALDGFGMTAEIVQGTVALDEPDYEDMDRTDFDDDDDGDDAYEGVANNPLHYWVEVDGHIFDITGDQFNDFLHIPLDPVEAILPFGDGRYVAKHRGWA
jgi:hypothetical protein